MKIMRDGSAVLREACAAVGLTASSMEPIRLAENEVWRLPNGVIARISPIGQQETARREIQVARWLLSMGVPAVRAIDVQQPVIAAGRPVTFWFDIGKHDQGTIADVAGGLKDLHSLPIPDFEVGRLDPFIRLHERLTASTTLNDDDGEWLLRLYRELSEEWAAVQKSSNSERVIHGDAWPGNIVRVRGSYLLMDLERFSIGPAEWDLVSTAVRSKTTGAVSSSEYGKFCNLYGYDVTVWSNYTLASRIRELRMVAFATRHAASNPEWNNQAQYRVDCIRGRRGPRPWKWKGIF
ncbi:phosphotransferase family protein [Streptomyces sp. NPDC059604]|uniref:phosphotransferase family protein n=1 Tax=Streptomyces sp. NPDC059604 TaxID=3346881 RepID=UPI00367C65FF